MKVTVDRIEEGFFVCINDGGDVINVPVHDIPFEVNECDILDITISDGKVTDARYLADETEAQRLRAKSVMEINSAKTENQIVRRIRRYARRQKYKPPGKRTQ